MKLRGYSEMEGKPDERPWFVGDVLWDVKCTQGGKLNLGGGKVNKTRKRRSSVEKREGR